MLHAARIRKLYLYRAGISKAEIARRSKLPRTSVRRVPCHGFFPEVGRATRYARLPKAHVIPAGVVGTKISGSPAFQVSSTGTLVFEPADFDYKGVVSVAREGSELALNLPPNRYGNPRISPDGRRLLIQTDLKVIETIDLGRGMMRAKLTAGFS